MLDSRFRIAPLVVLAAAGAGLPAYPWSDSPSFDLDPHTVPIGSSDSPEFTLDPGAGSSGWADSGTFELDPRQLDGAWSDSNDFILVEPPRPSGDLDNDRDVDAGDFGIFLGTFGRHFGQRQYRPDCDYDADGAVTLADYQVWLGHYRAFVGSVSADPPVGMPGDLNADGRIDLDDFASLQECFPAPGERAFACVVTFDYNGDRKVDLSDFAEFASAFTGP